MGGLQIKQHIGVGSSNAPDALVKGAETKMKEILIFLGGAMFGGLVAFLTFCMLAGIRMKSETKKKRYGEGDKANV